MNKHICSLELSDLTIGQTDEIRIDVTLDHIDQFAHLSGDHAPVHMNETFAKDRGYSGRIANGLLVGAFISQFIGHRLPGSYGVIQSIDIGFRKPLIPPETIIIKGEILNISQSVGQVVIKVNVVNDQGEKLAIAKVKSVVKKTN